MDEKQFLERQIQKQKLSTLITYCFIVLNFLILVNAILQNVIQHNMEAIAGYSLTMIWFCISVFLYLKITKK